LHRTLPLSARKAIVASELCRTWRGGYEFSVGLLDDLRRRDPDTLHHFLWSNHLACAQTYEVSKKFGAANLNPSRVILVREIVDYFGARGLDPRLDIHSILDVGCSVGHLLRHLEMDVCPSARVLHGIDIDKQAIESGMTHLTAQKSSVKLFEADAERAGQLIGDQTYDLVLCCGVLMYMSEPKADQTIRAMLARAIRLVGIICLADRACQETPDPKSVTRAHDGAFLHHVDRMIVRAGGRVVCSQLVGAEVSGSSPSYVILAEPPARQADPSSVPQTGQQPSQ